MCLFHLTGDETWLEPPFEPARDVRLIADPAAGYPEPIQQQIRERFAELLEKGIPDAVIDDPGPDRMQRMMNVYLGEAVPPEYVPMMREDMGFTDGDVRWRSDQRETSNLDVLIVGAGVSGLCLASKLDSLGIPFSIIERNGNVGGTWFENRYPGCGVDTPNHFYSYSFAPNPGWSRYFSLRDELQSYVEQCADRFGLRERIEFNTTLTAARWDERSRRWILFIRSNDGTERRMSARVLVCATGHFNQPVRPEFVGMESFAGEVFHTARWPDGVDLGGKRVGVIGTGASSMQVVPTIADRVSQLTIFQRTAQWARPTPEYNQQVDPATRWLFENLPYYARWYRFGQYWRYADGLLRFLRKDPQWPHPERSLNRVNDRHRREMTEYIHNQLATRPDLIDKCVPSYPPFGKRILIDNGWFETLCRPGVTLETGIISAFEAAGVRMTDGTLHELDAVILATGFRIASIADLIDIEGRGGMTLSQDWAGDDPSAYLGMTVPRFPNLFVLYGPNTNLGHGGSGIFLAETQTRYVTGCLVEMAEQGIETIECREDRRTDYTAEIDALHEELIWTHPGMSTYYRNAKGKVRSPMPFRLVDYWQRTHAPDLADFHVTRAEPRSTK